MEHHIFDCTTKQEIRVPLAPAEVAEREQMAAAAVQEQQAREAKQAKRNAAVQALKERAKGNSEAAKNAQDVLTALGLD